jgi:hypothetical protein
MALTANGSRRENIAAVRALYNQCDSYDDLLALAGRTRYLLAAQLANRIRNWRAKYHLESLDEAFAQHRDMNWTRQQSLHQSHPSILHFWFAV